MPMSKRAIIMELRPKWCLLRKQTYTEAEVIDLLCAFAHSLWPDMDQDNLRKIIIDGFIEGQNETI